MFCTNCGTEIKDNTLQFCTNCGHPLETSAAEETGLKKDQKGKTSMVEASVSRDVSAEKEPTRKSSKGKKILITLTVVLIIALFASYKWLENHYHPMKELIAMDEAIKENKQDTFLSYLSMDDSVAVDEKAYFHYIKTEEWNTVKDQYESIILQKQANARGLTREITGENGAALFYVKNKKHLFGLFKGYTLEAVPIPFTAISNMDDAKVKIAGKEVDLKEKEKAVELGGFYPGKYEVTATAKGEYGSFEYADEVEVAATDQEELDIDFEADSFYVHTDYGFEDAVLFINGKSTDKKIGQQLEIGPLPTEANMKLHAEWKNSKGNIVRSNTEVIDDAEMNTNIYFEFDERNTFQANTKEEDELEAGGYVLSFREAYEDAVNHAEFTYIEPYLKSGSHAAKDLAPFVKGMGDGYYYYEFDENTVTDVKSKKDGKFEVYTNEKFTFYDDDGKVYDYNRDKKYFLETVDGDLQITKIDYVDTKKNSK